MFNFVFGLVWTVFTTFMLIIFLTAPGETNGSNLMFYILFISFEFVGLILIISGLKKIIKDSNTKKYGVRCYGIVNDIKPTGSYVNNKPEYKAILQIVNPETHHPEKIDEIIGLDYEKFPINSYVLCKYYQGDINIEKIISENEVPNDLVAYLTPTQQDIPKYFDLEMSSDREYVTIDGVKYKREK